MKLILGVDIPRGMPKRSISSPSPSSLSIKKYDVPNFRSTKPRYHDRGDKNWISQPKLPYIFIFVSARDSHRFRLQLQRGQVLFFVFFLYFFGENVGRVFVGTTMHAHLWKKKVDPLWIVWLYPQGAPYKFSARKVTNFRWKKAGKYSVILSAGPARSAVQYYWTCCCCCCTILHSVRITSKQLFSYCSWRFSLFVDHLYRLLSSYSLCPFQLSAVARNPHFPCVSWRLDFFVGIFLR